MVYVDFPYMNMNYFIVHILFVYFIVHISSLLVFKLPAIIKI